jgi:hypothetical protein
MTAWATSLHTGSDLKLLVTSPQGDDLIKARLPTHPAHPRALLTMLEGIALYSGAPLCVVTFADGAWPASEALGEGPWPDESPLVRFELALPTPRVARRIRGVGDFGNLRRQLRLVWSRP